MAKSGKTKSLPESPKNRLKPKPDFRWLILCFVAIGALIAAIVINNQHSSHSNNQVGLLDIDNSDAKINWDRYQTFEINLQESIKISQSGNYHLTGNLTDGNIIVEAGVGKVRLILDNVTINNSSGPAILCKSADEFVIEAIGSNNLSDGTQYSSEYHEDIKGTIYSKADLTFQGNGKLIINGNYQDGIIGKDDLKFISGTYNITSADDGIVGKDSVHITGGSFSIESTTHAIKSTNTDTPRKGFILIDEGNFSIRSNSQGIKAESSIIINNGRYVINTYDDSINSNNYINIANGEFNLLSGDDAIHANQKIDIDGGKIIVVKAQEGIESPSITINDGVISLYTSDDGINAGNKKDETNQSSITNDCALIINDGTLYINASGDGLDSNGWIYFNGGRIVIDGPTSNKNSALDASMGIVTNGGEIIAVGDSTMANNLGSNSLVHSVNAYLDVVQPQNTKITIRGSDGSIIMEHVSAKSFNHITIGTAKFKLGGTYTLYLNDEKYQSFEVLSTITNIEKNHDNYYENEEIE